MYIVYLCIQLPRVLAGFLQNSSDACRVYADYVALPECLTAAIYRLLRESRVVDHRRT